MTWAPETNIKGPKGDTGATGATGAQGSPGVPGPVGPAGPPGASGAGTGNVVGPATSVVDDIATYNNISGTLIKDSGVKVTDLVSAATLPETIDDRVAALLVAGTNITLNYNDPANTLTINGTGSGAASGITVTPGGNISSTDVQAALAELDNEKVAKAGDTMTGPLVLPAAAPTLGPQAANKTYVDAQIAAITSPVYVGDTAPVGAPDKALWVETDTGLLFFRWNDGTSLQWVSLGNALGNAVLYTPQTLTSAQASQARANIWVTKRNYIINGGMQISQENGTAIGTVSGYYPVDQFTAFFSGTTGQVNCQQLATSTPSGSPYRGHFYAAVADATVGATDVAWVTSRIEGFRVADLNLGSASAKTFTLQFGVRAPAGTYCVSFRNAGTLHPIVLTLLNTSSLPEKPTRM